MVLTDCPPGPEDLINDLVSYAFVNITSLYVLNFDIANIYFNRFALKRYIVWKWLSEGIIYGMLVNYLIIIYSKI